MGPSLQFGVDSLLAFDIAGGPDCFVVLDLVFHDGVEDDCDFVSGRGGGGPGPSLAFIRRK